MVGQGLFEEAARRQAGLVGQGLFEEAAKRQAGRSLQRQADLIEARTEAFDRCAENKMARNNVVTVDRRRPTFQILVPLDTLYGQDWIHTDWETAFPVVVGRGTEGSAEIVPH